MPRVHISIGSNIEPERNIRAAIRALKAGFKNVTTSPVYESRAEGFDGDNFYNLAACFDTDEPLERLSAQLAEIEAAHGRVRTGARFAPRTLDIDILLYDDLVRHDDRYDIPRRDIVVHGYVLGPLVALAPDLRHPETGERLAARWQNCGRRTALRVVPFSFDAE